MTRNLKLSLTLLLVAVVVASSCAIKGTTDVAPQQATPPARAPETHPALAEETPTDESIGAQIRRRLVVQGPGNTAGIVIEVNDGVVTLRGVAPTPAAAWQAQSAAWSVKGVKLVRNQIVVNAPAVAP